ncbi:MAG: oxidoreductase, partial [Planctomycetota bacterium]
MSSDTEQLIESGDFGQQFDSLQGCYVHRYPICYRRIQNDDVMLSMAAASKDSEEDWYSISLISYQRTR